MEIYKDRSGISQPSFSYEESSMMPRPTVESLEDRMMFSGGPLADASLPVATQGAVDRFTHVYDMSLEVAPAARPVPTEVAATPVRPVTDTASHVTLLASEDHSILIGVYTQAQPLQANMHPAIAAISKRGSESLNQLDTQSYAGRPPSVRPMSAPPIAKRRVLLIEDDKTSRIALATLLKRRGWVVISASTLKEGLSQLKEQQPDNVIVDLMLPDGEGESVVQQIRDSHLAARVTVMTGVSDPVRLANLNRMHPESILSKPINVAALLREMAKAA